MDLNKGVSIVLHSDEAGDGQLKSMVDMGLMQARTMSGQMVASMPPGKEAEKVKEMIGVLLDGLKVERDGNVVRAAYRGEQSPAMLVGALAAVAIPAFVTYIRKSKASEVQMNLAMCHRAVLQGFLDEQILPDGTLQSRVLPATMKEPVCPGGKTVATLDGKSAEFAPGLFGDGGKGEILGKVGIGFSGPSLACYRLEVDTPGATPKTGQGFTCHGWTNIDGDDKPAHWKVRCVYQGEGSDEAFDCSEVERDPASDDW
jgi:hypothetical protein